MDELQSTVESLAAELNRSVYVEEPGYRPLAVSAHYGRLDQARIESLLHRHTDPQLIAYFSQSRIDAARSPVRISAKPEFDLLARLVVPVRQHGRLLGHIWLIDDPPIESPELAGICRASETIAELLWKRVQVTDHEVVVDTALLTSVFRGEDDVRQTALEQLLLRRGSAADSPLVTVTASIQAQGNPGELLLSDGRLARGQYTLIGMVAEGRLVALCPARDEPGSDYRQLSRTLRSIARRYDTQLGGIGIGSTITDAHDVENSLRNATYAAKIAECVPDSEGLGVWDDLGHLRLFADVPWNVSGVELLHPGLSALLTNTNGIIGRSLLLYLDHGGDTQAAATELNVHRTTLYYRIHRAEKVLNITLSDGRTRFTLHAGLELARLAGLLA